MSTIQNVFKTDRDRLARLMDLGTRDLWQPAEFGEIWRQQLDSALEFDLSTRIREATTTYEKARATTRKAPRTFRGLLGSARPPIALLKLAKDFAKSHAKGQNAALPRDIATMLYFACAAVALVRCGERITRLDDKKFREGVQWAIAQSWLDETSRGWFSAALKEIKSE